MKTTRVTEWASVHRDGKDYEVLVTRGYVMVRTHIIDCVGVRRTIDFPRVGFVLAGTPRFHVSVSHFVREARNAARVAIAELEFASIRATT
jgi:hypothetical protein